MTPATSFAGRQVALFGLGGSGLVTAHALRSGGARVAAWDDAESARAKAATETIDLVDLRQADWTQFAALILAPGVPLTHPEPHWTVGRATAHGIEIIGDIELFCRERQSRVRTAPLIAITGTNGKSTTTALIGHLLKGWGKDVAIGGNLGTAILALPPPAIERYHVIECSSFQIDLAPSLHPSIGLMLNVTPDHLDRHGSLSQYSAVKERLVQGSDVALIGVDDAFGQAMGDRTGWRSTRVPQQHHLPISIERVLTRGIYVRDQVIFAGDGTERPRALANLANLAALRGRHNAQNAAFAVATVDRLGLKQPLLQTLLEGFPGLAHRMETVARLGKVLFVNDSKATNADAAEKALRSFDDIFWIVGGKPKEGGIEPLRPLFTRIAKAYLIGVAADAFAATLTGAVRFECCGTLDRAVAQAGADALGCGALEPVVLLSPACASYDQFANFEERGDHFRKLVQAFVARQSGEAHDLAR
jgi:UDP-N-acetylmuramoylalanine--D-glutamate ligase